MKSNKILIGVVLVLLAVAGYYYFNDNSGPTIDLDGAKLDFAIEDTASIDKIFIVDPKGQQVTLNRVDNQWLVNNKYPARPDNIRLLMKTFRRIQLQSPVPKSAFKNVIKAIATRGTKVEIYQGGDDPSKVYYMGDPTVNQQGTYMLLETEGVKSTVPGIMDIFGFRGFLSTRFFADAANWRDPLVFNCKADDIVSISLTYFETPEKSFTIKQNAENIEFTDGQGEVINNFNLGRAKEYLGRYNDVYYEMVDSESTEERKDSVLNSTPFFKIILENKEGQVSKLVAYHMPNFRGKESNQGELFEYDVDRMYGYLNDEVFAYIQFATFDYLTVPKEDFLFQQ